jgi:octaprenyl-diphosphate synthase
MHSHPLQEALQIIHEPLREVEASITSQTKAFAEPVQDYIHYVCASSGKRLRPALALLSGGATGNINEDHTKLGVALEYIHMASLVHDDIIDEANLRRGQATINTLHGSRLSVFVGNLLLTHAMRLVCQLPDRAGASTLAEAAEEVCLGESRQTQRRGDLSLSGPEYVEIVRMKTAALFAAASGIGARLSKAKPVQVRSLHRFGTCLGIAYQIYDDCLDIAGNEKDLGKSLGSDLRKGKLTLPMILLLEASGNKRLQVEGLIKNGGPTSALELTAMVRSSGCFQQSIQAALEQVQVASRELQHLDETPHRQGLQALCQYVYQRISQLNQA